ncbi:MAG: hypothetical protein KF789_06465 [Bdellovibrionaceae bacterium]|nr:hypothetical protein [Pseudobdellovibrionaceae bacterium]
MKNLISVALILLTLGTAHASAGKTKKAVPNRARDAKLGTSFKFDGSSLHGKFQASPSTTATVENDKYLEDLLGARKNFDDRIAKDVERN